MSIYDIYEILYMIYLYIKYIWSCQLGLTAQLQKSMHQLLHLEGAAAICVNDFEPHSETLCLWGSVMNRS